MEVLQEGQADMEVCVSVMSLSLYQVQTEHCGSVFRAVSREDIRAMVQHDKEEDKRERHNRLEAIEAFEV
jgi:hypothetical protein